MDCRHRYYQYTKVHFAIPFSPEKQITKKNLRKKDYHLLSKSERLPIVFCAGCGKPLHGTGLVCAEYLIALGFVSKSSKGYFYSKNGINICVHLMYSGIAQAMVRVGSGDYHPVKVFDLNQMWRLYRLARRL